MTIHSNITSFTQLSNKLHRPFSPPIHPFISPSEHPLVYKTLNCRNHEAWSWTNKPNSRETARAHHTSIGQTDAGIRVQWVIRSSALKEKEIWYDHRMQERRCLLKWLRFTSQSKSPARGRSCTNRSHPHTCRIFYLSSKKGMIKKVVTTWYVEAKDYLYTIGWPWLGPALRTVKRRAGIPQLHMTGLLWSTP